MARDCISRHWPAKAWRTEKGCSSSRLRAAPSGTTLSGGCAMPTSDDVPQLLIDASVAVALVAADHEHHHAVRKAVGDRSCGLSGHAAFETFSVLTRLPPPSRRTPSVVAQLLAHNFPGSRFLSAAGAQRLYG